MIIINRLEMSDLDLATMDVEVDSDLCVEDGGGGVGDGDPPVHPLLLNQGHQGGLVSLLFILSKQSKVSRYQKLPFTVYVIVQWYDVRTFIHIHY